MLFARTFNNCGGDDDDGGDNDDDGDDDGGDNDDDGDDESSDNDDYAMVIKNENKPPQIQALMRALINPSIHHSTHSRKDCWLPQETTRDPDESVT